MSNNPFLLRQSKLSSVLEDAGYTALVLNPGSSLSYLTGMNFHLMERPVVGVFTPNKPPLIILPELETQKVKQASYPISSQAFGEDPSTWPGIYRDALISLPAGKIGVEHNQLRLLEFRLLETALVDHTFVDASDATAELRMYKDQNEIEKMQKAVEIAQQALEAALPLVKIGMSETELASELVMQLLRHGSEGELPFLPIVSTGPNGANPHATPSERTLAAGDLLVIDYGARYQGYISDITRTFAIAEASEEQRKVHALVGAANGAGRAAAKPGVTCSAVDQATREVITAAGFGQFFTHRTGHGIGMEPHEGPYIRDRNPMVLKPGMTFTIEPGIYLPDRFGVRIEDNVVVTEKGLLCLTTLDRGLQTIG